jgi:hypothetical protein
VTTPEKLRRRQKRNAWAVGLLCLALVLTFAYFRHRAAEQDSCLSRFYANQTETSKIRARLATREFHATRHIIRGAFRADTEAEALDAFATYTDQLRKVDAGKLRHPLRVFDPDRC